MKHNNRYLTVTLPKIILSQFQIDKTGSGEFSYHHRPKFLFLWLKMGSKETNSYICYIITYLFVNDLSIHKYNAVSISKVWFWDIPLWEWRDCSYVLLVFKPLSFTVAIFPFGRSRFRSYHQPQIAGNSYRNRKIKVMVQFNRLCWIKDKY